MRQLRDIFIFSAVVAVLGFCFSQFVGAYEQTIIARSLINVVLAVSLNLVIGMTGQFSMGHAGFMAVGAYTAASVSTLLIPMISPVWVSDPFLSQLSLLLSLLAGGVLSGLVGILVGIPSLRLRGDYLAIVTLGFGEIIRILILNFEAIGGARGFYGIPQLAEHTIMYWAVGLAVLTVVFIYRLTSSIPGKQFMAVRDDETATLAMGLSTTRIKVRAFVMGAFLAGIAGGTMTFYMTYLNPSMFDFNYSFQIIAMVVLGGMGSISGSFTAAILLTVLLEALRQLQDITGYDFRMVIYALVLIAIMLTRPVGMFGRHEYWTLFKKKKRAAA